MRLKSIYRVATINKELDDPFRSAMTFIQTSKHSMRTTKSMPLLVTNGADQAMPYMASDTFAPIQDPHLKNCFDNTNSFFSPQDIYTNSQF